MAIIKVISKIVAIAIIFMFIYLNSGIRDSVKNIKVVKVNPTKILVGQKFNIWEDKSVITIEGSNFTAECSVYINSQKIETAFGNGKYLTAIVPDKFFMKQGVLNIQVKSIDNVNEKIYISNKIVVPVINQKENKLVEIKNMEIDKVSPTTIFKGKKFNMWQDQSVLIIEGKRFNKEYNVYLNMEKLQTSYGNEKYLTAIVPEKFYLKEGLLKIQVSYVDFSDNKRYILKC